MAEQYDHMRGSEQDITQNVREITSEMEAMRASRREEDNQGQGPTPQNARNKAYSDKYGLPYTKQY